MARLKPTVPTVRIRRSIASPIPNIRGRTGCILTRPTDGIYQKKKPTKRIIKAQKRRSPIKTPLAGLYGILSELPLHSVKCFGFACSRRKADLSCSCSLSIKDLPFANLIPPDKFRCTHPASVFRLQFYDEQRISACCHANPIRRNIDYGSGFYCFYLRTPNSKLRTYYFCLEYLYLHSFPSGICTRPWI